MPFFIHSDRTGQDNSTYIILGVIIIIVLYNVKQILLFMSNLKINHNPLCYIQ